MDHFLLQLHEARFIHHALRRVGRLSPTHQRHKYWWIAHIWGVPGKTFEDLQVVYLLLFRVPERGVRSFWEVAIYLFCNGTQKVQSGYEHSVVAHRRVAHRLRPLPLVDEEVALPFWVRHVHVGEVQLVNNWTPICKAWRATYYGLGDLTLEKSNLRYLLLLLWLRTLNSILIQIDLLFLRLVFEELQHFALLVVVKRVKIELAP